ncbi:hypothetical protein G6F57_022352 [Rhizopus arrhizus]|nr:hypothetical protein G6F57_022352 [Rhizopus arrhizus]
MSERANARLLTGTTRDTVSNAVTGSTFHPTPQAATVAPAVLNLARTSDTLTVRYDHDRLVSPSQMHRFPPASDPKRTGRSETGLPATRVPAQRVHALVVCT